jgi:hypothetical protein
MKRIVLAVILLFTFLEAKEINILTSDENGCTFEISFQDVGWDTISDASGFYYRFRFTGMQYPVLPGEPMIPMKSVIIALPPDASIQVTANTGGFTEYKNVRLIPFPQLEKQDAFYEEVYSEGESYQIPGFQPSSLVQETRPTQWGDLRIVRLRITPLQYDPVSRSARVFKHITVSTRFIDGVKLSVAGSKKPAWMKDLILNSDMAAKWLQGKRVYHKPSRTFSGGPWYKIPITEENIYRITGKALKDHGIETSGLDISTLKIFNNGGRMLSQNLSDVRPNTLIELPILVDDGGDGVLNDNDAVYFYGKGVHGWIYDQAAGYYSHYINYYDTENIYWLTFNDGVAGKRISTVTRGGTSPRPLTSTPDWTFYEVEKINPIHSGVQWYSQEFTSSLNEISFPAELKDPIAPDTLEFVIQVRGGDSSDRHVFQFQFDGLILPSISLAGTSISSGRSLLPVSDISSEARLTIEYEGNTTAYLDWFEISYHRPLRASADRLIFSSPDKPGEVEYQLSGFEGQPIVWDVTQPGEATALSVNANANIWQCEDIINGQPKHYVAFRKQSAVTISEINRDDHVSDLRNTMNQADMIIISPALFFEQAKRLKDMRETLDTLQVMVVDIQDVYDEFSWGLIDPTAIRDFMASAWHWERRPQFLLLFGDATYAYGTSDDEYVNWIPTYELDTNSEKTASAVDEWFVRVNGNDEDSDMAVGRFPVQTEEEARIVVDKVIDYETGGNFGSWRSVITLVADDVQKGTELPDSFERTHVEASEVLYNKTIPGDFNVRKIYLTEYKAVIQADGRRKPEAKDDLFEQINLGTLIVNYIGHGHESVWAHEQVLLQPGDLSRFDNSGMLPLFFGATCTFARYDFTDKQSLAENLLLMEDRGSIASIGASRECFADPNEALNQSFLKWLLSENPPRAGESLRLAKVQQGNGDNNEKYNLMGDPALRLAVPKERIQWISLDPDSFKALAVTKVGIQDSTFQDYSGTAILSAFDSDKARVYEFTDNDRIYQLHYQLPGNTLFRGQVSIRQGELKSAFIVPKDISYGQNRGRISLYAYNDDKDVIGFRNAISIGGSADIVDQEGPEVRLYFNENPNFVSGGLIQSDPELVAEIEDKLTGVNMTSEIGHKMMLTLDDAQKDVSDYFQYDKDSFLKGTLKYKLSGLNEGTHTLSLKVWDNANNSSASSLVFQIVPRGELRIQEVLNYPNPFSSSTHFTFQISHSAEISIKIYTVDGRLIRNLSGIWAEPGFNMIGWNGEDEVGDPLSNGVYIYKIQARADIDGKSVTVSEISKLMRYR